MGGHVFHVVGLLLVLLEMLHTSNSLLKENLLGEVNLVSAVGGGIVGATGFGSANQRKSSC